MSVKCPWLEVANPAEFLEPEEVSPDLVAKVVGNDVGIAGSEAWMETHGGAECGTIASCVEDIAARYPFNDEDDGFVEDNFSDMIEFWSPRTISECRAIMRSLKEVDPNIHSREWIYGVMTRNLGKAFHSAVTAGDPLTDKLDGLLVYNRFLTFHEDYDNVTATINYHMKVFHAEGSPAIRQGLLMALHDQGVVDIECAVDSMKRAGISADLRVDVHVEDDDDGMYAEYVSAVELARHSAFGYSRSASMEDVELTEFGYRIGRDAPAAMSPTHGR